MVSVDPRIFSGFLEHLGRAVYEGVYDPNSPHADENGFRKDVLDALNRMRFTAVRYPGGNFASGYHWQDGIGPKENRPTLRDLAWQSLEPNQFGTDEFMTLSRMMGWDPMICVNLGQGKWKRRAIGWNTATAPLARNSRICARLMGIPNRMGQGLVSWK